MEKEETSNILQNILKPGGSTLSKFLGVLAGALFYHIFSVLILPQPKTKNTNYSRKRSITILNAIVLSAAYVYSWTVTNPHTGQAIDNTPIFEIPLMLTAGYYALDLLYSRSFLDNLHHIVSIGTILTLLPEGKGANIAVTFAFLVEIATLVYIVRNVAMKCGSVFSCLLGVIYPAVFISVRLFLLLHLSYNIQQNKDLPEIPKNLSGLLFLCTFCYCYRMIGHIYEDPGFKTGSRPRTPRSRRRSRTMSRSGSRTRRSRSRTRSRARSRSSY